MTKGNFFEVNGKVIEILPNAFFKIELENGKTISAYTSGKMKINNIRIIPGDKVKINISPANFSMGRITYRYK